MEQQQNQFNPENLTVIILAAGKGQRMRSSLPKVLHPIGGKPMLAHVLEAANVLSPNQTIIVYGNGGETVIDAMSAYIDALNMNQVSWVEQKELLGTGDAVAKALPLVNPNNRVLVLLGDVPLITSNTLKRLLNTTDKDSLGVLTVKAKDPTGLGRIIRKRNKIVGIIEEKDASELEQQIHEVNTGIFALNQEFLAKYLPTLTNQNAQSEYYLTDLVKIAANNKISIQSSVPNVPEEVMGINNRVQQVELERYYQEKLADKYLQQGASILDPKRFDVRGSLTLGQDVIIDINAIFEGDNTIGNGVKIGPNCVLKNCIIGDNVEVYANSFLEDATISQDCKIGPYARIRPGTKLAKEVKVGNFVEIKASDISEKAKVNHLSYIGDAYIGARTNIGAGTITCNYDGQNKHKTKIGENVFIGSGTQLIAPVNVGNNAHVAAGSVLCKDAQANKLTLTHRLEHRDIEHKIINGATK